MSQVDLVALSISNGHLVEAQDYPEQHLRDLRAQAALIVGKSDKESHVFSDVETQSAICTYLGALADNLRPLFLRHDKHRRTPGPGGERWRLSLQSIWGIVKSYAAVVVVKATPHHSRHL